MTSHLLYSVCYFNYQQCKCRITKRLLEFYTYTCIFTNKTIKLNLKSTFKCLLSLTENMWLVYVIVVIILSHLISLAPFSSTVKSSEVIETCLRAAPPVCLLTRARKMSQNSFSKRQKCQAGGEVREGSAEHVGACTRIELGIYLD